MTLHADFDRYLSHLGHTVPVSALHFHPDSPGLCALRHDVDHDLDIALEMAHREHETGAQATYFILPTAPYWEDPRLIEKCLQLQDYGHEVGLHVNCMAEWAGGETDDPEATLRTQLARLRDGGVEILGISAHGDRRCYENQVSNYWCFRELRPAEPFQTENGRTAEGPFEADGRPRLVYPESGEVVRPDGARQTLWSISMASLGLQYHAWHTPYGRYFSDSGGAWSRTSDPLTFQRGSKRWQVLMHPIHWQGQKRRYFFLSTARSGSRWITEVLDQATPLTARHEYILNQDFHRGEAAQKATANFRALEDSPETVRARLSEAWEELESQEGDYAEVNVYLATFVEELRRFFPDAVFVHLHRHPARVVRSIMERDWYDTPEDHAHPRLKKADEAKMNRFERVCQYVAEINDCLQNACDYHVGLEELTRSPNALANALRHLGIIYHPRLGDHLVATVINATRSRDFPSPDQWTAEQQRVFEKIIGNSSGAPGQSVLNSTAQHSNTPDRKRLSNMLRQWMSHVKRAIFSRHAYSNGEIKLDVDRFRGENCKVRVTTEGIVIQRNANDLHAHLTLGGSRWNAASLHSGWPVMPANYVQGTLEAHPSNEASITVFAISYGKDLKQIYKRQLGVLDVHRPRLDFAFSPHPEAGIFDIALYMSASQHHNVVALKQWHMQNKVHNS